MPRPGPSLLLALAAALAACGGNPEKKALRSYEASVEDLMAEDGRVSARLADIREDLLSANAASADQAKFGREQALPFFRRFVEAAGALSPEAPRLQKIHGTLREYLVQRIAYLDSIEAFLAAEQSPAMERLKKSQAAVDSAQKELAAKIEGTVPERDVAEAVKVGALFNQQVLAAFQQGRVKASDVEDAIRQQVIPRLERVADRLKDRMASDGVDGATARWAKVEVEFYRDLAASVPWQEETRKSALQVQDHWKQSEDLRARFLEDLKAYRESLR